MKDFLDRAEGDQEFLRFVWAMRLSRLLADRGLRDIKSEYEIATRQWHFSLRWGFFRVKQLLKLDSAFKAAVSRMGVRYNIRAIAVCGLSALEALADVTVDYPAWVTASRTATRTASQSGSGTIAASDGVLVLGTSPLPRAEAGGSIGSATFSISDTSGAVDTWVESGLIKARTQYSESTSRPWTAMESGTASFDPSGTNEVEIASSTLRAPNADTHWTVVLTDGSPRVIARMEGSTLRARIVAPRLVMRRAMHELEIEWEGGRLESAPALSGPWEPVNAGGTPYRIVPSGISRFFRIAPE